MRAAITGGAGFMGLHLAKRLLDSGVEVVIVDNFERGAQDEDLARVSSHPLCSLIEIDLCYEELPLLEVDAVAHFAAIVGVGNVTSRPYDVLRSNAQSLLRVLDWASRVRDLRHFLFTSTSEVYGVSVKRGLADVPTPESAVLVVEDPIDVRGTYMLSKIYGEALVGLSGLPWTVVRPHNVYGPRMGMSHVVPELLRKCWHAQSGESLQVASIDHTRTFLYIDDATAFLSSILEGSAIGEVVNLGSRGPEITIGSLAELILEVVGRELSLEALPATAGSPPRRVPDTTRIETLTGLRAGVSLRDGITRTYAWYRTHAFEPAEKGET